MSVSLILVPLAIALSVTLQETAFEQLKKKQRLPQKISSMETDFTDNALLAKTLHEHGLPVNEISDNLITVKTSNYELRYERTHVGEAFMVSASGWHDIDKLAFDINCFEKEYKSNVQSYTYNNLLKNLSENGMSIENEIVLEDNSILLTINI